MARRQPDPVKEQAWRERLEQQQQSGLSVRAFCSQHNLTVPSFYAWRRTLRQRAGAAANPSSADGPPSPGPAAGQPFFVPLRLAPTATTALELLLPGGLLLRVPTGFDADTLRRLLALLRETPC
jgi:transposase-like protein